MSKRSVMRWIGRIAGGTVALVLLSAASLHGLSARRAYTKYTIPEHALVVATDSATIARGAHLATIRGCNECHAATMAGRVMADDPAIGRLVSTNLTNGRRGGVLTDRDWERAVRHGVRRDSTPLSVMPAHEFTGFADEDLAAIVAWTRSLPAVTDSLPAMRIGPVARALHTAGELILYPAERIDHDAAHPARVVASPDAAYGAYMAAGCTGCHGATYAGGKIAGAPPDWPAAGNLTPTGLKAYDEARFIALMRTGKRPDGTSVRAPMDPRMTGVMTDVELRAIWAFLQTLPPRETGAR
jgi:mono/diheme cytochrome c family protein